MIVKLISLIINVYYCIVLLFLFGMIGISKDLIIGNRMIIVN